MERNQSQSAIAVTKDVVHLSSWRLAIVICILFVGIFLFGLDVNIIGVAIPKITTEFGSLGSVAWYGAAYLLTVTAFQPGFGNLYRYFNAKSVYLVSLLLFEGKSELGVPAHKITQVKEANVGITMGSAICASAPSSDVLIFGRAILGVGAAGLLQGALAIVSYAVPLEKVPAYQGIVIAAMGLSVCVGPVIGGALTQYTTWRWCFWINVPTGVVVMIVILFFVPVACSSIQEDKRLPVKEKLRRMDPIGTIIFLSAICCLLLGLVWGGVTYPWNDSKIIGLFVGFGLLLICFGCWLRRQGDVALIPLRILRKRSVAMGSVTLFAIGLALNVYGYYLPLFFQSAQGVSSTMSGVRQIALIVPDILAIGITGFIVTKWGYYVPYMIAGTVIAAIGAGLLINLDVSTPTVEWAAYLVVAGIGIGMSFQLPYTAVQAVLDPADVATGNAIAVFSSQLSGAIGVAVGQDLFIHKLSVSVMEYTDTVTPAEVIAAGAGGIANIASSPEVYGALRQSYADGVRWTLILALASICVAFPASCAMEWLNIKRIAEQRKLMALSDATSASVSYHAPLAGERGLQHDEEKAWSQGKSDNC